LFSSERGTDKNAGQRWPCVEAYFCLVPPCGIVSFSSKEKERRKKGKQCSVDWLDSQN